MFVTELRILSKAETPPFEIVDGTKANEMLRLKLRYLDLRRPELQKNLMFRHKVAKITRDYFDENGFLEIETPTLIKSTPEGARDFPGAQPHPSGQVLRSAPVPSDLQAAVHGGWF